MKFLKFLLKESLAEVFSCEFSKISKNTFFTEHLRTTASTILQSTPSWDVWQGSEYDSVYW